jgi:hypothetical protein
VQGATWQRIPHAYEDVRCCSQGCNHWAASVLYMQWGIAASCCMYNKGWQQQQQGACITPSLLTLVATQSSEEVRMRSKHHGCACVPATSKRAAAAANCLGACTQPPRSHSANPCRCSTRARRALFHAGAPPRNAYHGTTAALAVPLPLVPCDSSQALHATKPNDDGADAHECMMDHARHVDTPTATLSHP